ncbi:MAG: aldehyde dehydrogenase family protein [Actinomycetota bacterium]|nr:aldehyde dehydrogenase family protein [Actinomycetota bacterium]
MTIVDHRVRGGGDLVRADQLEREPALGELAPIVAGTERRTGNAVGIESPYDRSPVAVVHRAGPAEIEAAITAAREGFATTRRLPSWRRSEILERVSAGIGAQKEELARTIALEGGKPIKTARVEVDRAAFTFKVAAEEAKRIYGEIVPLDWIPGTEGRIAHVRRVPLGPVAGITPFNFPLMLVAHKVAPSLAAGNPIVVRPASQTPVSSFRLARLVLEAGWPEKGIAVVPSSTADARPLVEDERIAMLTFTGSPAVGWSLRSRAGRKRVTLELGGNAPVIVNADADPAFAAERVAWGANVQSGQSCISVQRVYVHSSLWDAFVSGLVERVGALAAGDPLDEETDVGPLIDDGARERVQAWVEEAIAGGARALVGGEADGPVWQPTVLTDVQEDMKVACEEVFAPVVSLFRFDDVREAIRAAGTSSFGLQAGLFTNDVGVIDAAFEEIEVGGLMVNDVPTFRVDHMPYGGVKQSGFGREGLRYAIEEMTELKLVTFNHRGR